MAKGICRWQGCLEPTADAPLARYCEEHRAQLTGPKTRKGKNKSPRTPDELPVTDKVWAEQERARSYPASPRESLAMALLTERPWLPRGQTRSSKAASDS